MQEKRSHPRTEVNVTVNCERKDGSAIAGVGRDISLGGLFVEASEVPPFGTELTIVGRLPGMDREARLPAVVRWTKPGGFGVQFGLLGARETHAITRLKKP